MAPVYKVAIIQLYPKPMHVADNFAKAAEFVRAAAQNGAKLAVLPEYHLTNWLPKDPKFRDLCADWETYLQRYQSLAKECDICIVPGTIVQTIAAEDSTPSIRAVDIAPIASHQGLILGPSNYSTRANDLENVAYFIDNTGTIIGKYVKKNLWGAGERMHLRSSGHDPHPVFDTPLGKAGILVCWDLAFPEAWRELIAQGAKLVIVPTFWTLSDCSEAGLKLNPSAEALFIDSTITTRAFENTCAVIFVNAGGPPGRGYMGLSQVTVPFIGPLTRLGSCQEGMSIIDLDMQILEDAEANYQVRADLDSDGWHYEYRHGKSEVMSKGRL